MPKVISAQRPFTMLLGTLRQGSDPSLGPAGNPDISRTTVTMQYMPEVAVKDGPDLMPLNNKSRGQTVYRGNLLEATGIGPIASGGTVLVTSATFNGPTTLVLGQYTITTDEDYTPVVGDVGATGIALTAAITALPGYSASDDGAGLVTIVGPVGLMGNMLEFRAGGVTPNNYTLTSARAGYLSGAEPTIGPVTFTTT